MIKARYILGLFTSAVVTQGQTPTARDYFNELKTAKAFRHYKDEYVCFRDDNEPSFVVMAKIADIVESMKKDGVKPPETMSQMKDSLLVQAFSKGVAPSDGEIYERVPGTESTYDVEFMKPLHGRMVYAINWLTGRYRQQLFQLDQSKTVPTNSGSGKCELIHPDVH